MGWLRSVGSFKLLVAFAKEPHKRDYILQKRPIVLRSLIIKASPYARPNSLMCMPCMCNMTDSYVWHDSFICVTWCVCMCGVTHSYVWHDSFICVTWLVHAWDMTHWYVWRDSLMCLAWSIHVCDMTQSTVCDLTQTCASMHVWMSHVTHMNESYHNYERVMPHLNELIHMCDMTHSYVWHDSLPHHIYI